MVSTILLYMLFATWPLNGGIGGMSDILVFKDFTKLFLHALWKVIKRKEKRNLRRKTYANFIIFYYARLSVAIQFLYNFLNQTQKLKQSLSFLPLQVTVKAIGHVVITWKLILWIIYEFIKNLGLRLILGQPIKFRS